VLILVALLSEMGSLNDSDRDVMIDTARFLPNGQIASLYLRIMMQKCSDEEINNFFMGARAFMISRRFRYGDLTAIKCIITTARLD
jgi:hypothetical protein